MNTQPHTPRILIVDDDLDLARSIALIFKHKGYRVSVVADGLSAIQQVQTQPWDIVLMDIKMPGLDGVETYQRIKDIQPNLAVILMTGFADEERVQAGLRAGALAALTKPLNMEQTLQLIEEAVHHHHALALIVDGYPESRAILMRILQHKGYTVACVEDEEQAIALVQQQRYQIIFIELERPTIDSIQTCHTIRTLDPNVTIVMIISHHEKMDALVQAGLQNSVYACLYKPFDIAQVLALVNEIESAKLPK